MNENENLTVDETVEATEPANEASETATATATATEGKEVKGRRSRKAEAEIAELTERLAVADAALAEEKEKYLRMLAEYDNFRRRTAKEKDGIYADAMADTVKAILPVIDNLERAAAGVPEGEAESAFAKGVAMTLKSAVDTLAKLGVTEIETATFDPNLHNAVMHVEDETLPEGAIVEVFQKGYKKDDRVIRYAMVKVAN
jgi:molecular chaperone GrpE